VRSFQTYARNRSLTTGTFNRVVKDRIARSPERRRIQSSQAHTSASLTVLETLQTYRAALASSTHATHRISTIFPQWEFWSAGKAASQGFKVARLQSEPHKLLKYQGLQRFSARNGIVFRFAGAILTPQATSGHARTEDEKLRKELTLEVLALKVPFGSLLSVSESNPVAGAIQGIKSLLKR